MIQLFSDSNSGARSASRRIAVLCLALIPMIIAGCGGDEASTPGADDSTAPESPFATAPTKVKDRLNPVFMPNAQGSPEPSPLTARETLEAMAATYKKADSYADFGQLQLLEFENMMGATRTVHAQPMSVLFKRPNKFVVADNRTFTKCDGARLAAMTQVQTENAVVRDAPETASVADLFPDPNLFDIMAESSPTAPVAWAPVPFILLTAEDPLKTLVPKDADLTMLAPVRLPEGQVCDRVAVDVAPFGRVVYWIERDSRILRRIQFPMTGIGLSPSQQRKHIFYLDLENAQLNNDISETSFALPAEDKIEYVEELSVPGLEILGSKFDGLEIEGFDGVSKKIEDFHGREVLLLFWSTPSNSRGLLIFATELADRYADRDEFEVVAVNIDDPNRVRIETLKNNLAEWSVDLPNYRLSPEEFAKLLPGQSPPTVLLLDDEGVAQNVASGSSLDLFMALSPAVEATLQGVKQSVEIRKNFDRRSDEFRKMMAAAKEASVFRPFQVGETSYDPNKAVEEGDGPAILPGQETVDAEFDKLPTLLEAKAVTTIANESFKHPDHPAFDSLIPVGTDAIDAVRVSPGETEYRLKAFKNGETVAETTLPIAKEVLANRGAPVTLAIKTSSTNAPTAMAVFEPLGRVVYLLNDKLEAVKTIERPEGKYVEDVCYWDFNGDGANEIALTEANGENVCLSADGEVLWTTRRETANYETRLVAIPTDDGADLMAVSEFLTFRYDPKGERISQDAGVARMNGAFGTRLHRDNALTDLGGPAKHVGVLQLEPTESWLVMGLDDAGRLAWRRVLPSTVGVPTIIRPGHWLDADRMQWLVIDDRADGNIFPLLDADGKIIGKAKNLDGHAPDRLGVWNGRPAIFSKKDGDIVVLELRSTESTPAAEAQLEAAPAPPAPPSDATDGE